MYNVTLLCNNNVQILGGNFMASQQTPNYKLSRWAGTDRILMEDFNADNEKIEAALAAHAARLAGVGNCKIEYGTYIGDGTYGQAHQQTLPFSGKPLLVSLTCSYTPAFCIMTRDISHSNVISSSIKITPFPHWDVENGVRWWSSGSAEEQFNTARQTYFYCALLAADE